MNQIPGLALAAGGLEPQAALLPTQTVIADLLSSIKGHANVVMENVYHFHPIPTDWHPKEKSECIKALRTLTLFAHESVVAANLYTRDICTNTAALGLPAAQLDSLRIAQSRKFQNEFSTRSAHLGTYHLSTGNERYPAATVEQIRYGLDHFSKATIENDDYLIEVVGRVPNWYQMLLSPSTTGILHLLPAAGRAMYFSVIKALTSKANYEIMEFRMEHTFRQGPDADDMWDPIQNYLLEALAISGNMDMNLNALVRKLLAFACMMTAVLAALSSVSTNIIFRADDSEIELPDPSFWPPEPIDEAQSLGNLAYSIVDDKISDRSDLTSGGWALDPVPRLPSHSLTQSPEQAAQVADKKMKDLLRPPNSQYRLPMTKHSQTQWQNWLSKMHQFDKQYPLASATGIISHLICSVQDKDPRIIGWQEKEAQLQLSNSLKFSDFLSHIKGCSLATVTTRHDAFRELEGLAGNYKSILDCLMMSNKLSQLMSQIFPLPDQLTAEQPPCTRVKACTVINGLLSTVKTTRNQSVLYRSWSLCYQFEPMRLYETYLVDTLHQDISSENSDELCDAFMSAITGMLVGSHTYHVSTHGHAPKAAPLSQSSYSPPDEEVAGINDSPKGKRQAPTKNSSQPKKAKTGPDQRTSRPAASTGSGSSHLNGPLTFSNAARQLGKASPHLAPGVLRSKHTQLCCLDHHAVNFRMKQTQVCYICLELSHYTKACPLRENSKSKEDANELYSKWSKLAFPDK